MCALVTGVQTCALPIFESDVVDFARWMQAMMGERPEVLPKAVLQIAHHSRVSTARPYGGALRQATSDAGYGLGWRSFTYDGLRLEGHSGAVSGYRSTLMFEPATRTGIVALWNSDWGRSEEHTSELQSLMRISY